MPGNEVGDRVHNFFAQENLSQGQQDSQVDGTWPVLGNNLWPGSQRHIGLPNSVLKNYNLQQSDTDKGHSIQTFPVPHGLNPTQPRVGPEFAKSHPQNQQPILNGYMHRHQILQTRESEANFLGVDTESDHCNRSRGLSIYGLQQETSPQNYTSSVRSESSEVPVSFNLFGSQQMSGQLTGVLQTFPPQQSGVNDMQLLQQQAMLRKLQRQQQIQQIEGQQQNKTNQIPTIIKQVSGTNSSVLTNSTPISLFTAASDYRWATEPLAGSTNWLQHANPAIEGSSNGFRFPPEQGQTLSLMGLVPQQVDQALYGVPVSSRRGTPLHHSHILPDKLQMQQMTSPGNQCTGFQDQVHMQDESLVSGQNSFQEEVNTDRLDSGMNLEKFQEARSGQRNAPAQEVHERQELAGPSEMLPEKITSHGSSQNVVSLDPTEERILFGDDNIWDAFGSDANMGGGYNRLYSKGFLNGFPSLQSGSWSALMQSAVAETSSNDLGLQEDWNGVSFQNTPIPAGSHQTSAYANKTKQQKVLAENSSQIASSSSSGPVPLSDDANMNKNHPAVRRMWQSGRKYSYGNGEMQQTDFTGPDIHQSSQEGINWLSHRPLQKPLAEGSQVYGNAAYSSHTERNEKNILGMWVPQRSGSSFNSSQPDNRTDSGNVDKSASPAGGATLKVNGNEDKLQQLHRKDHNICEDMSHGIRLWKADSGPNVSVRLEHINSSVGSPQVNNEDRSLNNIGEVPNSSTRSAMLENASLLLSNSHHFNYWQHANSLMKNKGGENLGNSQHHQNNLPVLESSMNIPDKDAVKLHEADKCDRKENSSDSHGSNLSQHPIGGSRDNGGSDASDPQNFPGGRQKLFGQAGQKTTGARKFQYHPMGNLEEEVEPSYGMKHTAHSQVILQAIPQASYTQNQGYFGQSKISGQFPKTSSEMEKEHSHYLQGTRKGEAEVPSTVSHSGFAPRTSVPFDRSVSIYATNKSAHSRKNMLELLHKVDQSNEGGDYDGSVDHPQQNQSSVSQGFGLQLAPPSQHLPVQNHLLASQKSTQTDSSSSLRHATPELRDQGHAWLGSAVQGQSLKPSRGTSQGKLKTNKIGMTGQTDNEASQCNMPGNLSSTSTAGFRNSRSKFQSQQMIGPGGKVPINQPTKVSFDRNFSNFQQTDEYINRPLTSQSMPEASGDKHISSGEASPSSDTNYSIERASTTLISGQALPSSQPFVASGISQKGAFLKMMPNAWATNPSHQHLRAQPYKLNDNLGSTSSTSQDNALEEGKGLSEVGANSRESQEPEKGSFHQPVSSGNTDLAEKMSASQGKESIIKNQAKASSCSASTQREIEAFGRSLKPNNLLHENYSLLHQIQVMKSTKINSSNMILKRSAGADGGLGSEMAPTAGQSGPSDNLERKPSFQLGNVPSQDVPAFIRTDSETHSNSTASIRVEQSQIGPQMAPSWFNKFGSSKNGQMLPMYGTHKNLTAETLEQPFTLAKSTDSFCAHGPLEQVDAAADSSEVGNIWKRPTVTSMPVEHVSSSLSPAQNIGAQYLVAVRPKKRKTATSELLPWHKEVTPGSRSLLTMSMAEINWVKAATNRLADKVEDEADITEDGPTMLRTKRRLILTTQLMQQLFPPPLGAVLSADAGSNYETLTYMVARLALGDACSSIPFSESDSHVPLDSRNLLSDKCRTSETNGNQHLSKAVEGFTRRARELENDFMRLDKRASVLDLRMECQDVENFSLVNRFARYYGRGQADRTETSSSSAAGPNAQRLPPERYVTAFPVPRILPDRVQCLSL
ncbi:uncharacterized protein LOC127789850 [Diospyros lotus]|uniref:uncharacterized protein LOC127789850 n=1 Tax=Diospyros lotus TaxID=55363 RepID=UPI00225045D8|nr:uncharacterized protein LOC127789850 [Diospyros lotus]XP_052174843.1 uncharacterized protein LOC127789850 [Diospyros lotus]XP_052174844.1 uncharacterized protein LOC127789850 [Diospyros lotus]